VLGSFGESIDIDESKVKGGRVGGGVEGVCVVECGCLCRPSM
jgi:hypothetical protein